MGNAVVTGTVDLAPLEVTSTDGKPQKLARPVTGDLLVNGVTVSLASDSVASIVDTVNRFARKTVVTASIGSGSTEAVTAKSSAVPEVKYLVLTSPNDIRLDGDYAALNAFGLAGGVTPVSTDAAPASTGGFFGAKSTEATAKTEAVAKSTEAAPKSTKSSAT